MRPHAINLYHTTAQQGKRSGEELKKKQTQVWVDLWLQEERLIGFRLKDLSISHDKTEINAREQCPKKEQMRYDRELKA